MADDDVPLADPSELAGFPGAPFTQSQIDAVADTIRRAARWHIAPEVEETVVVASEGGQDLLFLPTLWLVTVAEVRHVEGPSIAVDDDPVVIDRWSAQATVSFRAGMLKRLRSRWPDGVFEVDITHGHETCPPALLGAIAEMIRGTSRLGELASKSIGDRSESWRDGLSQAAQCAISAYTIPRSR